MVEVPTTSADVVLQDMFNQEMSLALDRIVEEFNTYKLNMELLYQLEGIQGPEDEPTWREHMNRMYTKVEAFDED